MTLYRFPARRPGDPPREVPPGSTVAIVAEELRPQREALAERARQVKAEWLRRVNSITDESLRRGVIDDYNGGR